MSHFKDDFEAHLIDKTCPTGSCLNPKVTPKNTRPYATDYVPELVKET